MRLEKRIDWQGVLLESWHPYAWIFFWGFLIYLQTLFFNFTYLDDNLLILKNFPFISNLSNIAEAFKKDIFLQPFGGSYYRPLVTLSFMLDAQIGGNAPFIYHLTNVILHLLVACLLFLFLLRLRYPKELALFFSLIFAIHPVLNQAVAWIPGRNDSLLTIFVLLSFIAFLNFLDKSRLAYFWHLLFFALALFTKETAVMLPLLCILYLKIINQKKLFSLVSLNLIAGWIAIMLPCFFIRRLALNAAIGNADYDIAKSVLINFPAVVPYIGKIFFPFKLSVLPILQDTPFAYGIIAVVILASFLIFSKNKRINLIIFGVSWFLLFLLPSFIQSVSGVANFPEHRIYLPVLGVIILFLEIDYLKLFKFNGKILLIVAIAVIIFFSSITIFHCENFRNRISFWKSAVKTSPASAFNHNNLGSMYYLEGALDKAEAEWKKAAELNPGERLVHGNLGLLYMIRGQLAEAQAEYKKELEINPYYDNVYFNLGLLYYRQGKLKEAADLWKKTLQINPDYADAYKNLATLYYEQGDSKQSLYYVDQLQKRGILVSPEFLEAIGAK